MESQNRLPQPQSRETSQGTTFLRTCFNLLNALSGIGILSVPFALSQGGWMSLLLLLLVAIICYYTGLLLRRCMDSDPSIKSYPDIGERAFGYRGRALVAIFMYLELYLLAVEFLILEGDNLDKLFPNKHLRLGGMSLTGKQGFVLLASLVVLPTTWLKSLHLLAYVSAGGALAPLLLVGCVLWVGAVDGVGFHEKGVVWDWAGLPTAISLFTFCYCAHAVFPTLYNSMKDRGQFSKVLLVCFVTATFTYGSIAILAYLMYGEHLMSQVTLNLPIRKMSAKIAIYTTLVNPLAKYALITTPIATAIEDTFPFGDSRLRSIIIRTTIVISTVVVALTIPLFGYVMAFIGAFLSATASMLLPCLCYLRIKKAALRFRPELMIIGFILVVGIAVGIAGTYTSVREIVNHL